MGTKIRVCIDCKSSMTVHKNSGKLRCDPCNSIKSRERAREWYSKKPRECRIKASFREKEKLKTDTRYRLFRHSKKSASTRGLEHTLKLEDIVVPAVCPVLKCPMEMHTPYAPTLDRIDSSKGYTKNNIQVISWKANTMKSDATLEELKLFALWVNKDCTCPESQ